MAEHAFISIGSNVEPEVHLPRTVDQLHRLGRVLAVSRVYQCPAVGPVAQPDFLNAAARVLTDLSPLEARGRLREIESNLGRLRTADKYAPRTVDLDLCLYGAVVLHTVELTLPHPEITRHAYVAVPLAELAPLRRHPSTGEPLQQLARRLGVRARLAVRRDVVLHPDRGE